PDFHHGSDLYGGAVHGLLFRRRQRAAQLRDVVGRGGHRSRPRRARRSRNTSGRAAVHAGAGRQHLGRQLGTLLSLARALRQDVSRTAGPQVAPDHLDGQAHLGVAHLAKLVEYDQALAPVDDLADELGVGVLTTIHHFVGRLRFYLTDDRPR